MLMLKGALGRRAGIEQSLALRGGVLGCCAEEGEGFVLLWVWGC